MRTAQEKILANIVEIVEEHFEAVQTGHRMILAQDARLTTHLKIAYEFFPAACAVKIATPEGTELKVFYSIDYADGPRLREMLGDVEDQINLCVRELTDDAVI